MARALTAKEASKRLYVTPQKHKSLDHISVDTNRTLIEVADEALEIGLRHLRDRAETATLGSPN